MTDLALEALSVAITDAALSALIQIFIAHVSNLFSKVPVLISLISPSIYLSGVSLPVCLPVSVFE